MKIPIPETESLRKSLKIEEAEFRKLKDEYQEKSKDSKNRISALRNEISKTELAFMLRITNEADHGMAYAEAAKKYKCTPTAVRNWIRIGMEKRMQQQPKS
jgi:uncharacterized protein YeaO (DUF488 family)